MSILSKFVSKPETVKITDNEGVEHQLLIKPISVDKYLQTASTNISPEKKADFLKSIFKETIKESIPDATDEEINSMTVNYFNQLLDVILKVNGLSDLTTKKKQDLSALSG